MKVTLFFLVKTTVQGKEIETTIVDTLTSADEAKRSLDSRCSVLKDFISENGVNSEIVESKTSFKVISNDKDSIQLFTIIKKDIVTGK